jgi:hypothetical protein
MTGVPIACTLSSEDVPDRVAEWRRLLERDVAQVSRTSVSARLRLREGERSLLVAIDLARREKACCSFLEFRLVPLPEAVWLEIEAPAGSCALLDQLLATA